MQLVLKKNQTKEADQTNSSNTSFAKMRARQFMSILIIGAVNNGPLLRKVKRSQQFEKAR